MWDTSYHYDEKGSPFYVTGTHGHMSPILALQEGNKSNIVKVNVGKQDTVRGENRNTFRQRIFEHGQPYQPIVDRAVQQLGDPFVEGEVLQFQHLTQELLGARQEVVDARAEVRHAQQVEMLASSALAAARQAVDAPIKRFEQAGAYCALHLLRLRDFLHIRTYAFTYRLQVTVQIQISLPGVMCPCIT